ncbi:MAG: hypothetical protein HYY06_30765 [Deltaproteobacteria bacterium]|nr:hypothetical protein [Deltaproteobacteria bacterium]
MRCFSSLFIVLGACATEIPPGEPTFDEGGSKLTLYQVQDDGEEAHPEVGETVRATNLVVTVIDRFDEDGSGKVGTVFAQEIGGGPYSGIQLYAPNVLPAGAYLLPGDVVEVEGTYAEFELGQINPEWADETGRTITQLTDGVVRKTGEWLAPEPTLIEDPADLFEDPAAESWEGVLVELEDVEATAAPDSRGSYPLTGGVEVDDDNYRIEGATSGLQFARIAGVISYIYSYKLLPRSALDVEIAGE